MSRFDRLRCGHARQVVAAWVAAVLLGAVGLSGCTSEAPAPSVTSPSAEHARDSLARTSAVAVDDTTKVKVSKAQLSKQQEQGLTEDWPDLAVAVGEPIRVEAASIPAAGIKIVRRYSTPLPEGMAATLIFYDEELPGWRAVASQLAPDRMSVSATVHHLSFWTDVVGAFNGAVEVTEKALTDAAVWTYVQVGAIVSTRADRPKCQGDAPPDWVDSVNTIEDAAENPIRFCVGSSSEDLVVKATINRGFGFTAQPASSVTDIDNTSFDAKEFDDAFKAAVQLDDAFGQSAEDLLGGPTMVGAGETLTLKVDEAAGRKAGERLLSLSPPDTPQFLVSLLARLVGADLGNKADGWVGAALMLAQCGSELQQADDGPSRVKATLTCASGLDQNVAQRLSKLAVERNWQFKNKSMTGAQIGRVVGKVSIYLALVGPVFDTIDYLVTSKLDERALSASLFVKAESGPTLKTLQTAEVPAACEMPKQRLKQNRTTIPGNETGPAGQIMLDGPRPVLKDIAGLGYDQVISSYSCSLGGVGLPPIVILTGAGGKLLGHIDLTELTQKANGDRGLIDKIQTKGRTIVVKWTSTSGCCTDPTEHQTTLTWTGSNLVVSNETTTR